MKGIAIHWESASDALGRTAPLCGQIEFPVMGHSVCIASNSRSVIELAAKTFGHWRRLGPALRSEIPPCCVTILVQPENDDESPLPFVFRYHSDCFLAASGANLMMAEPQQGKAIAFVTPALVADGLRFCREVLECLSLLLVTRWDRTPVHAAAVMLEDTAILLLGPGGSGKSTLCYACAQQGFQLLAEDAVYVSVANGLRVWGSSTRIQLCADTTRYFPELNALPVQELPNGKQKRVIELDPGVCHLSAERLVLCLLHRHENEHSWLEPVSPQTAMEQLLKHPESGFDLFLDAESTVRRLAEQPAFRLHVGSMPHPVPSLLKSWLRSDGVGRHTFTVYPQA